MAARLPAKEKAALDKALSQGSRTSVLDDCDRGKALRMIQAGSDAAMGHFILRRFWLMVE